MRAVNMVLYCPKCGTQHIDAPDDGGATSNPIPWTNPPHKSHLCHGCGHIWRPSDTPTNGVERTASGKDADTAPLSPSLAFGDYTISRLSDGTLWIARSSGEGMQVSDDRFDRWVAEFYSKHF